MISNSDSNNNSLHPHSLKIESFTLNHYKKKPKNTKGFFKNNILYDHQRKKGDMKYLEKYVHKYFISFYKNTKNDYNIRMIEDILNNESTHLVAEFKDYLIMGDITEFLQKSYNIEECKKYLPKIYEYYNSCSVIFPNYVKLHESKYIYKNIRKKQKVIDNQQEQEEKQEKIKKGEIEYNENEDFLTTKTFYSILDQTNTSNIKNIFGVNDKVDMNETPNNIVEKLKKAEKDAIKRKLQIIKNNSKLNLKENNTLTHINNSNINKKNNSKICIKNKSIKERNKNKHNIHYLSHIQKKKMHIKNNSNINIKMNLNDKRRNKIKINNYLTKEYDSKKYIKSSSSINDTENDINKKKNYITFYGNKLINSKKKEVKKLFYENSNIKHNNNIFINSRNNSNKNIKKKYINSLLPTKTILSRLFTNFNNSILSHNSYINKKLIKKNTTEENKKNYKKFSVSPSSITIQANSFRKRRKYNFNMNMNLKESKSTRNIINNKLNININNKSKELFNLKNIHPKTNRNLNLNNNYNITDYNSNTLPTSTNSKIKPSQEKIVKTIHINSNFNNSKNGKLSNNFSNFKTVVNNALSSSKINIKNNNNANNANNINNLKYKNMQKINSTSNIKNPMNPMNMNININMNNNSKNKIYLNDATCTKPIYNKLFSKSPFSLELETIKVTKRKRILYPKKKTFSDLSNKNNNINSNNKNIQNLKHNNINNIANNKNSNNTNNTISKDRNYYLDSLVHTSSNSNNINDELMSNGFGTPSTINYLNTKKDLILEELYKKKNIILPFKKEINNINININGYNIHSGSLTSRISTNNISRKKSKKNNGIKEINFYKNDNKILNKNKKNNSLRNKIEGNPIKIRKIYDNNGHINANKSLGSKTIKRK